MPAPIHITLAAEALNFSLQNFRLSELLLAAATPPPAPAAPSGTDPIVIVVLGLISMLQVVQLATKFIQRQTGSDAERKIEPTQIGAIHTKLDSLVSQGADFGREIGEVKTNVAALDKKISETDARKTDESSGIFNRLNAVSQEVAALDARVGILEKHIHR